MSGGGYTGLGDDAAGSRPLDTNNRLLEKRLAGFDTPHNLVLSWGYELPFGKGKRFLRRCRRCYQPSCRRLAIECHPSLCLRYPDRREWRRRHSIVEWREPAQPRIGSFGAHRCLPRDFDPARDRYLDINAFSQPAPFTLGNAPPVLGDVRNFGLLNEDFSILKDFTSVRSASDSVSRRVLQCSEPGSVRGALGNLNAPATFGRISGQANAPRNIQLALKYTF